MGGKSGSGDGQNPDWGRPSGTKQTSAVIEGQKYITGLWTFWTRLESRTLLLPVYSGFTEHWPQLVSESTSACNELSFC